VTSIFKRVDVDHSHTVTLDELLEAMPTLKEGKKDGIRDVFYAADDDGSGELNAKEFRDLVLSHTSTVALPLVVAEISRCLIDTEVPL
jgi:Ca2+-binding EF-hand superfamily protein